MPHPHIARGGASLRPRVPELEHFRITTTDPVTLVAADTKSCTFIYHLLASNSETDMATVTIEFGGVTKYVLHIPASGGTVPLNLIETEPCTKINEAVTATLSEAGGVDITIQYILNALL